MIELPDDPALAFQRLDPHHLLDAIDAAGWHTDGRVSALNSYENRVYSVGLEDGTSIVAKFYRPARWSDAAIDEEHAFCHELVELDLPVIEPLANTQGRRLLHAGPFRFCVFPRVGGRPPELDNPEQLEVVGRTLGRLHTAGQVASFGHRPVISPERLGDESLAWLKASEHIPLEVRDAYLTSANDLMQAVHSAFRDCPTPRSLRLHGDFHPGNMLWGADGIPQLLDFDDCATGPAVQDLWMFISGDRSYAQARLGDLLDGYHEFHEFDTRELVLVEPLRALRIIHYAAWIARRWEDPAFQRAFPFFGERRFWDEHIGQLREQRVAMDEPALRY